MRIWTKFKLMREFFSKKNVDTASNLSTLLFMHINSDTLNDTLRSKLYTWAAGHFLSGWDQTMDGLELERVLTADEDSEPELLEKQKEITLWGSLNEDYHHVDELIWCLIESLNDILPDLAALSK